MIKKIDKKNKFISMFDPDTGFYMRSGVMENGKDTGVDPFMASGPELLDIGIMQVFIMLKLQLTHFVVMPVIDYGGYRRCK